jgi:formate dehydrogenase major subunit
MFEHFWGVAVSSAPGLRIPNMMDEALDGSFKGLYVQGEDIAQSDPDTHHVTGGLRNMECVVIQDIFLNETAKYAHVFLPGASFLEKDGTFTNAERRIGRVRKVMAPLGGYGDWEGTMMLSEALGYKMHYKHPSEIMDEIAATTPSFSGVSFQKLDEMGSIQWPCNAAAPNGTPTMHVGRFVIGKGKFMITEFHPTEERAGPRFPLILTTGRILSQYNVGAQTRRTANSMWHEEDVLEIHPFDAEQRGILDGDLVALESRSGDIALKCKVSERMQPGVVYTTFHHAKTGANVITTDYTDWATDCPEYKVTAVQVRKTNRMSEWQAKFYEEDESLTRVMPAIAAE